MKIKKTDFVAGLPIKITFEEIYQKLGNYDCVLLKERTRLKFAVNKKYTYRIDAIKYKKNVVCIIRSMIIFDMYGKNPDSKYTWIKFSPNLKKIEVIDFLNDEV